MSIETTATVGELASQVPSAARIFEKYGVDYCCGGSKTVAQACESANVNPQELLRLLESPAGSGAAEKDYSKLKPSELIDHIVSQHHVFTRYELARLARLIEKVISVHGTRHPELLSVQDAFQRLYDDLAPHLLKEENILFPYIVEMEKAAGAPQLETPPFVTVRNPVRMMLVEHETAGELLGEIKTLSSDYTPPADACVSFRTLYMALDHFERDLHQHIHLENNILFPRAIEMEKQQSMRLATRAAL